MSAIEGILSYVFHVVPSVEATKMSERAKLYLVVSVRESTVPPEVVG
jgi:hypothetical protein